MSGRHSRDDERKAKEQWQESMRKTDKAASGRDDLLGKLISIVRGGKPK